MQKKGTVTSERQKSFLPEKNFARTELIPASFVECIILSVNDTYMDAQEVMHMTDYSKITALYSRLSVGDEDRDGGESNSIQNQELLCRGWFLPPNTYDCGSFVVNGTAVVGKE